MMAFWYSCTIVFIRWIIHLSSGIELEIIFDHDVIGVICYFIWNFVVELPESLLIYDYQLSDTCFRRRNFFRLMYSIFGPCDRLG